MSWVACWEHGGSDGQLDHSYLFHILGGDLNSCNPTLRCVRRKIVKDPLMHILLAETDASLLQDMKQAFEQIGHGVIAASNGMRAWAYLTGTAPDLLVTCIHIGSGMPPGTALGMHAQSRQPRIPVIYTPASLDWAKHANPGHGAILIKPFAIAELISTAQRLLYNCAPHQRSFLDRLRAPL